VQRWQRLDTSLGCGPTALTLSDNRHCHRHHGGVSKKTTTTELQNPGTLTTVIVTALQYAAGPSDREGVRLSVRPSVTA